MVNVARFLTCLLLSTPIYNISPFVEGFSIIGSCNVAKGRDPLTDDGMPNLKHRDRFVPLRMLSSNENDESVEDEPCSSPSSSQRRAFFHQAAVGTLVFGSILSASPQGAMAEFPDRSTMNGGKADKSKSKTRLGGLPNKIRSIGQVLDELQRDLMQERWDLVEQYPVQLRSYVPVFTTYTDSAFPSDEPTDKGLRVALRYEVGRFFASLERFRQAVARRALSEAYVAYSDMALHFDRYLHVGGLYTYYDDVVTTEVYFKGISESALVYVDPMKDPPDVRDLVVLVKGPDKGKTGTVIGIYPDGTNNCAVKLDRSKGMREIKIVPRSWAGKRLGEQDPDDVFLIPRK